MRKNMNKDEKKKVDEAIKAIEKRGYSDADVDKVLDNEPKIKKKFNAEALKKFAGHVPLMFSMIKDYKAKKYRAVPVKSIVAIVATLLYVFLPADVIPDIVPALGFTDDAVVVAWCLKMVASDLEKYKEWKDKQADIKDVTPTEDADSEVVHV